MIAERGLALAQPTIMRWAALRGRVREALEPIRSQLRSIVARQRNVRKIRGKWSYLYRAAIAVGHCGLPTKRESRRQAAKAFFRKALKTRGRPPVSITLDGYAVSLARRESCASWPASTILFGAMTYQNCYPF
jgi:transposase-like protein